MCSITVQNLANSTSDLRCAETRQHSLGFPSCIATRCAEPRQISMRDINAVYRNFRILIHSTASVDTVNPGEVSALACSHLPRIAKSLCLLLGFCSPIDVTNDVYRQWSHESMLLIALAGKPMLANFDESIPSSMYWRKALSTDCSRAGAEPL